MAKQKQDNKTVDIELLILRDKIECLIDDYSSNKEFCVDSSDLNMYDLIIKDLKGLLDDGFAAQQKKETE